jgi:hypothetical protein
MKFKDQDAPLSLVGDTETMIIWEDMAPIPEEVGLPLDGPVGPRRRL